MAPGIVPAIEAATASDEHVDDLIARVADVGLDVVRFAVRWLDAPASGSATARANHIHRLRSR